MQSSLQEIIAAQKRQARASTQTSAQRQSYPSPTQSNANTSLSQHSLSMPISPLQNRSFQEVID